MPNSVNAGSSPTCPVLRYNGYTYWAWSDANNDVTMAVVAYDSSGQAVKQWNASNIRYIWQITMDEVRQTVTFWGQGDKTFVLTFDQLFVPQPGAGALTFASVGQSALYCMFAQDCMVAATDTDGAIPLPANATGSAVLHTRTFVGAAGSAQAGKTAYAYNVDMTQADGFTTSACVTDLSVDFGAVSRAPYDGTGLPYDVFVVNQGGPGSVGLFDVVQTGGVITFVFEQPICGRATSSPSSYYVGVVSSSAPKAVTAKAGWPGMLPLDVPARAPAY